MATTTYRTTWGDCAVEVSANWAEASCPVEGVPGGRQVADFQHQPQKAMRAALEAMARAEGLDLDDDDTLEMIESAIEDMEEVE